MVLRLRASGSRPAPAANGKHQKEAMATTASVLRRWHSIQVLQTLPDWKVITAPAWALAWFSTIFTRTRTQVPLDEFHTGLEDVLARLRVEGTALREDWSARNYADDWVARRFLSRPRADGVFVYELTGTAARFLAFLDGFNPGRTSLNTSRLSTLLGRIESLAQETDPDKETRISQLQAEIAQREAQIKSLENAEEAPTLDVEHAVEAAHDVLDLAASLPQDFRRMRDGLEEMLHGLRQEIIDSNATKGITMGEVLEADRRLRSTPEGRTYESFTAFLNDDDQQARLRSGITEVLSRDFTDHLDGEDRQTLYRLVPEMRAQAAEINTMYGRLSESLHTYVQSDEYRESVQLRQAIRAAEAALHQGPRARKWAAVLPAPALFSSQFESTAATRLYDPDKHQPPARLAAPAVFSPQDVKRSPKTAKADHTAIRSAIARARARSGTDAVTPGQAFDLLPAAEQHINSLRALLHEALNSGTGFSTDTVESITFTQIDGTRRTAYIPTGGLTKTSAASESDTPTNDETSNKWDQR